MKIEQPGKYRTSFNHMAVVTDIRRQFALGWVEKDGKYKPTSWDVNYGTVWNGDYGDDLVAPWVEPQAARPTFQITTPGLYRDESDRKIEVLAIRNGFAIGYLLDTCSTPARPLTAFGTNGLWDAATGRDADNPGRGTNLVAEWLEPVQQTVTFALVERQSGPEVVWERNIGLSKVLAIKTITITEGEGMQ